MALSNPSPIHHDGAAGLAAAADLDVRIFMFGIICQVTGERQTTLRLPRGATVRDIIDHLGERYGADFLRTVMRTASRKASHSAIAVNGYVVQDIDQPVASSGAATIVEIILLPGHEGG